MKMAAVIVDVGGNSVNSRTAVRGCLYYSVSISPTPALLPLGIERASFAAPRSGNFLAISGIVQLDGVSLENLERSPERR